jgi:hypothetical protein
MQSHQMSAGYIQDAGRVRCCPGVEDAAPGGGSAADGDAVKFEDLIGVLVGAGDHGGSVRDDVDRLHIVVQNERAVELELLPVELLGEYAGSGGEEHEENDRDGLHGRNGSSFFSGICSRGARIFRSARGLTP